MFFYSTFLYACFFLSSTFVYGIERPIYYEPPANPCLPNPCGPNSICRVNGHTSACSCLPNYIGRPPQCRPECTINSECPANLACINERCKDPCVGSCGISAVCNVVNHSPICTCQYLYTGDPFSGCHPVPSKSLIGWLVVVLVVSHYSNCLIESRFTLSLNVNFENFADNAMFEHQVCANRNESDLFALIK